ncbi:hypothetical protein L873DRAFT_1795484 [Choiromyces venosus 120613-1]|uniref:Uncharacterized protein n=1 Tax=Choiromyces venosus 120613-1 TaxID=1336337 RepID=A0A3N4IWA3_9PEZI|nr:hypothetical protein L873DRAFT_1795484 [Choiromyces venosus 120613-1]
MSDIELQPALGPLPDLRITMKSLHVSATQAKHVATFPTFDQRAQILVALQQLQRGVAAFRQELADLQRRVVELQQSVVELQQGQLDLQQGQAGILEHFNALRMILPAGTKTTLPDPLIITPNAEPHLLEPFYGLNGQLIPDFPRTAADIGRLNRREILSNPNDIGDGINALLVALGLEVTGTVAVRKERFKRYIGLVTGAG